MGGHISATTFTLNNVDTYEILITKYMSTLEILSNSGAKPTQCSKCGQNVYSISKRVKAFLEKAFNNNEYRVNRMHKIYSDRSKFLHEGKHFSNRAYLGVSIPQLSKSDSLIDSQSMYDDGFIKYGVGTCFDYFVNNMKLD